MIRESLGFGDEDTYGTDSIFCIALSLARSLELQKLYQIIVQQGCLLTQTSHGFIYIINQQLQEMELAYGQGAYQCYQGVTRKKDEPSVSSTVWKTGRPLLVENIQEWQERAKDRPYGWEVIHSVLGIPLHVDSGVTGVIGLGFAAKERAFTVREADLLGRFATLAAAALHNARLYTAQQEQLTSINESKAGQQRTISDITAKEKEVLLKMATGMSNKEIALNMGVELSTIKTHVHHLLNKLEVRSRAQALVKAWELGLICK